ncbi:helix-turn-helix transcriptional regulator [Limosilactobacillus reuteri]|uniref:helix-turn-helix transcriptional regulator n=1 Tax=Limosilactobacillus reuteri TaxID=1598 RepID=UPI0018C89933|nr:helix-turn-helix transcriptional regulator [Limosilactobacillus reuteri]
MITLVTVLKKEAYKELKSVIDKRGLKQNYVAREIGITPNYLGQILNGNRKLSADVAIKAAQVLGLPLDVFLNLS